MNIYKEIACYCAVITGWPRHRCVSNCDFF